MAFYPVNLQIENKLCVVVGGGSVAARKVRSLLGGKARVQVVSPAVVAEIQCMQDSGLINLVNRGYQEGDLEGAFLAFTATDNRQVQARVSKEAQRRKVLLNSADEPVRCDFQIPATVRRGDLLLTVSTGGASPALSRQIREQLEVQFGEEYVGVVQLFAEIRERVVLAPGASDANRKLFRKLLASGIVEHARARRWQIVHEILDKELPATVDASEIVHIFASH